MVLPSIVLFLLVIIVPFIEGVIYSFTEWRGSYFVGGEHWWNALVGLKNYTSIFKSKNFLQSLGYTAIYAVLAVIAQNGTHDQEAYQGQGTFQNGTVPSICTWNARHGLCMAFHI